MKTTTTSLCIALGLVLGCSNPALADPGDYRGGYRGDYRGGYRGDHRSHYSPPQHDHHGHSRRYGWVAPAAVLAIAGIAAGVAASNYYAPRSAYVAPAEPVYVTPAQPVYVEPPSAFWNYCGSVGQYYPNVRHCPEGWQLVPAR